MKRILWLFCLRVNNIKQGKPITVKSNFDTRCMCIFSRYEYNFFAYWNKERQMLGQPRLSECGFASNIKM